MPLVTGMAEVNRTKLYYEIMGQGHPLVLIHGGLLDCRMWDGQFKKFAEYYKVIRYDIRGYGKFALPKGKYSHVKDLLGLLKFLEIEKAHIIGLSLGGANAIDFALEYPDLVSSLILTSTAPVGMRSQDDELAKKTLTIYESEILPIPHDKQKKFHLLDIPNQKFYILVQPHLEHCMDNQQFTQNPDLIVFLLQWSLFIAFDKYKFVHGDILEGSDNSVLCHTFQFFGKQFCIVKFGNLIWKFPLIDGKIPCVIMFDFGFSEFTFRKHKINNIVPFTTPDQFPLGSQKLLEEKRKQDILGLNIVLKKNGIQKQIPFVKTSDNKHLLNNFDNYKITEKQFNELDPNIYFLFDGTGKKI